MLNTEFSYCLESQFQTNIVTSYSALGGTLAEGENPIKKIQLIVSGNVGNMYITYLDDDKDGEDGNVSSLPIHCMNENNRQGGGGGKCFIFTNVHTTEAASKVSKQSFSF